MKTKTEIWIYPLVLIGVLLMLTGGCKKKDNNDLPTTIAIGSSYAGGIIFYLDSTGQHGLVCTSKDQYNGAAWGIEGENISTGSGVGTGAQNTVNIVKNFYSTPSMAAGICNYLILNGYNDWFLPSKDELMLMYFRLHKMGIGSFNCTHYWSSTQATAYYACWMDFDTGFESNGSKGAFLSVRAVRAF